MGLKKWYTNVSIKMKMQYDRVEKEKRLRLVKYFKEVKENFLSIDRNLSCYATKSDEAIRLKKEEGDDIRTPFFRDVDRIIYAMSYTRYSDKTQVYSFLENDHISKRIIHVQFVSKIARTIGRALGLNTDLIEAIALGHDIGHTPLGHTGEALLNEISLRELNESFAHNIQSVRTYMDIENEGQGLNLSIQVLDGIMCHNGEILSNQYVPEVKDKDEFLREYHEAYTNLEDVSHHRAMTLEGCVVRISDIIGYIGRDIEDAIRLHKIKRKDIPSSITSVLGDNNRDIINTIVTDIISNSYSLPYIKLSNRVYQALVSLKRFNYEHIYCYSISSLDREMYRKGMNRIYQRYFNDLENENHDSVIYQLFLNHKKDAYLKNTSHKRMVIDFIAGMTDDLFLHEIKRVSE